jgi:signal transduction histidine kinase
MQFKLMLLFLVFALVPLCSVGVLSIRTAEELILRMATNQIEQVVADKAALLERWITERKADVEVIAGSSILRSMDSEQIIPYLDLVRNKYKVYGDISVLSLDGNTIYHSPGSVPALVGGQESVNLETGKLSMSDITMGPYRRESYFRISAPLFAHSGDLAGVVSASVGTGTILSFVLRVSLGETGECYLVNRNGTFLAHKEPGRILNENIAQSESFKNIFSAQKHRVTYIDYRGIEVIGASMMVGGTDWALVVEQDRDEAFHSVSELRQYIVLGISLSLLGALVSAWLLSRYVATPIRRLSKAADSLARGEFERVNIETTTRGDEVGLLYDAFGKMARQLQDRQQRLEEKVTRREAELKETDVRLKRTEEAAARSQQLASLGQLAAGVAHEIRTPLTSLKMFLQSIESELEISSDYEEDFEVAMKQVKRMEATINRFLDFARPQAPVFTEVDVRELIEDALLVAGPRAKQQETLIGIDIGDSLPRIRGDRKQLEEALLNLMINGLEAVGLRGELNIKAGTNGPLVEGELKEFIRIDISDSGPGIEKDYIPSLFDPFFTTKSTGTGLGLSIVDTTLRRHGGGVCVESSVGGGATFSLLIPVRFEGMLKEDGKDTDR